MVRSMHEMPSYIGEAITVQFNEPLLREKTPNCPSRFSWGDELFIVERSLREWVDFSRRGKFERNMKETHLEAAQAKGSFGVGRFSFVVLTTVGRVFEIYFDRTPTKQNKTGIWILYKELNAEDENGK